MECSNIEIAIVIAVVALFATMIIAAVLVEQVKDRPLCHKSNPGAKDMELNKCHECDEREECLR